MEVEREEVRKREKMRVVGTQKGPGKWGKRGNQRKSRKETEERTVEVRNASENVGDVVLAGNEGLVASGQDRQGVDVEPTGICKESAISLIRVLVKKGTHRSPS